MIGIEDGAGAGRKMTVEFILTKRGVGNIFNMGIGREFIKGMQVGVRCS